MSIIKNNLIKMHIDINNFYTYKNAIDLIALPEKKFNISDINIKKSMNKMRLRGRLEEIKSGKLKRLIGKNRLIIDGGHNINSAISISNWVKQQNEKVHLICGMMNDKPHKEFVNQFENFVNSITTIPVVCEICYSDSIVSVNSYKDLAELKTVIDVTNPTLT